MAPYILNDASPAYDLDPPAGRKKGYDPSLARKLFGTPTGSMKVEKFPDSMLIPEDVIDDMLEHQRTNKSTLLDWRERYYDALKSLDQDGLGLCWAFSSTKAMMYLRIKQGQIPIRLSAWWVAGKVKNWRDQGGWGAESLQQIAEHGVPEESFCPSYRSSYDNEACRADAALHKCLEWWEGDDDPEKAFWQASSAHAMGLPTIEDYNWWGHSVNGVSTWSYKQKKKFIDNSWGETAGDKGIYTIEGRKTGINGLWIPRLVMASGR